MGFTHPSAISPFQGWSAYRYGSQMAFSHPLVIPPFQGCGVEYTNIGMRNTHSNPNLPVLGKVDFKP